MFLSVKLKKKGVGNEEMKFRGGNITEKIISMVLVHTRLTIDIKNGLCVPR